MKGNFIVLLIGIALCVGGCWYHFREHGIDTELLFGLKKSELLKIIELNEQIIKLLESRRDTWSTYREFGDNFHECFFAATGGEFEGRTKELEAYINQQVNDKLKIKRPRMLRKKLSDAEKTELINVIKDVNKELKHAKTRNMFFDFNLLPEFPSL